MTVHIPAQPTQHSPPASQNRDAERARHEQAVIQKLFRRLMLFLFVLFVFSFLDRINIGFAGLTMSQIRSDQHNVRHGDHIVLCDVRYFRHSQ